MRYGSFLSLRLSPRHFETFMQIALAYNLGSSPRQRYLQTLEEEMIK
jgi:hypothetical protein